MWQINEKALQNIIYLECFLHFVRIFHALNKSQRIVLMSLRRASSITPRYFAPLLQSSQTANAQRSIRSIAMGVTTLAAWGSTVAGFLSCKPNSILLNMISMTLVPISTSAHGFWQKTFAPTATIGALLALTTRTAKLNGLNTHGK